ncbi:hypothetical protein C2845_PM07G07930 [Panicum miliaceum]|uniref:Uncharacterized protein n=1 Tax=Panicum miliaceum TaxID=4540 RepID=A0A3L6SKF1_PANMI|nr:hypothetical protein C2845_PM07G07930 [Panicum miliaceum]
MDPSSYPTKDMSFSQSDDNISPLHQALRGKMTMPALSSSVPNAHAPKESNMLPANDHSFQRYYSNSEAPPPQPHLGFTHAPPTSTIASAGLVQSPAENEQELMRSFLTMPVGKFLSVDERVQVLSMEPPSITSLIQGNKTAILHAHLDIAGALDPDPIFQDLSSDVPKEKEMHKLHGSS